MLRMWKLKKKKLIYVIAAAGSVNDNLKTDIVKHVFFPEPPLLPPHRPSMTYKFLGCRESILSGKPFITHTIIVEILPSDHGTVAPTLTNKIYCIFFVVLLVLQIYCYKHRTKRAVSNS